MKIQHRQTERNSNHNSKPGNGGTTRQSSVRNSTSRLFQKSLFSLRDGNNSTKESNLSGDSKQNSASDHGFSILSENNADRRLSIRGDTDTRDSTRNERSKLRETGEIRIRSNSGVNNEPSPIPHYNKAESPKIRSELSFINSSRHTKDNDSKRNYEPYSPNEYSIRKIASDIRTAYSTERGLDYEEERRSSSSSNRRSSHREERRSSHHVGHVSSRQSQRRFSHRDEYMPSSHNERRTSHHDEQISFLNNERSHYHSSGRTDSRSNNRKQSHLDAHGGSDSSEQKHINSDENKNIVNNDHYSPHSSDYKQSILDEYHKPSIESTNSNSNSQPKKSINERLGKLNSRSPSPQHNRGGGKQLTQKPSINSRLGKLNRTPYERGNKSKVKHNDDAVLNTSTEAQSAQIENQLTELADSIQQGTNDSQSKTPPRCIHFPRCLRGNECGFFHPLQDCPNGATCQLASIKKCKFVHPNERASICKYDNFCKIMECGYYHIFRKEVDFNPYSMLARPCQFFETCLDHNCLFYHIWQKLPMHDINCKFKAKCFKINCQNKHPNDVYPTGKPRLDKPFQDGMYLLHHLHSQLTEKITS